MQKNYPLLFDYQIIDKNPLIKLVSLCPIPLLASISPVSNLITLWFLSSLTLYDQLKGHKKPIFDIIFSIKRRFLYSSSLDNTVKVWNSVKKACLLTIFSDKAPLNLKFSDLQGNLFFYEGFKRIGGGKQAFGGFSLFDRSFLEFKGANNGFIRDLEVINEITQRIAFINEDLLVIYNYELDFKIKTLINPDKVVILGIKGVSEGILAFDSDNWVKIWDVFKGSIIFKLKIQENPFGGLKGFVLIDDSFVLWTNKGGILIADSKGKGVKGYIEDFTKEGSKVLCIVGDNKGRLLISGDKGKFKGFEMKSG